MSTKRVVKTLQKNDWRLIWQRGSHKIYEKNGIVCLIPDYKGDIPKGTLANITRITGVKF